MQRKNSLTNSVSSASQLQQQPTNMPTIKPELEYIKINNTHLMTSNDKYNITYLKSRLIEQQILSKTDLLMLIDKFYQIIRFQQNLVKINGNVTIVGDIHGQFRDFMKILSIIGSKYSDLCNSLMSGNLLFLGDYVDRGFYGIQVLTVIMALKVNSPKNVICLRGNHECRGMTVLYNFKAEVLVKYDQQVYSRFMEIFDGLPLACLVNNTFFCVHGGISQQMIKIQNINKIERFQEIPAEGPFCDFMWADPLPVGRPQMYEDTEYNDTRLCSVYFGDKLANKFLQKNKLCSIIRAHQVFPEGFQRRDWNKKQKNIPGVITVFSAPNYCGMYGNKGAILHLWNNNFEIRQYREELSQKKMPEFPDIFQLSIPQIVRVLNQFTKNMMESLSAMFLKKQFPQYCKATPDVRLQFLLEYVRNHRPAKDQPNNINKEKNLELQLKNNRKFSEQPSVNQNSVNLNRKYSENYTAFDNRAKYPQIQDQNKEKKGINEKIQTSNP